MAAERAAPAALLASSSVLALLLGTLITLAVVYALLLFIKSIAKLRPNSGAAQAEPQVLCQNCAILHGARAVGASEPEGVARGPTLEGQLAKQKGGYLKCGACLARFKPGGDGPGGHTTFYGNQQHQIIFGKSKDSILVPDWFSSITITNGSSRSKSRREPHEQRLEEEDEEEEEKVGEKKSSSKTHSNSSGQQAAAGSSFDPPQSYLSGVTTRVLTDEKGHSIKVRIASPPPQRQSQLAKQIKQQQLQLQEQQQFHQNDRFYSQASHRDSFASDCALISLPSLIWDENIGLEPEIDECAPEAGRCVSAPGHNNANRIRGPLISGSFKRRGQSEVSIQKQQQQQQATQHETRGHFREKAAAAAAKRATSGAPIDAFNDSNTSEYDDVPGDDSRQDTSIDYLGQLETQTRGANNQPEVGANSGASQPNSNEQVMDADLCQMNRLNLQLALLQNNSAGQQQAMMRPGSVVGRHNSLCLGSSSPSSPHHHHSHLPQSGILPAVGQGARIQQQQTNVGQTSAGRRSSEEAEADFCGPREDSRRSSGFQSSGGGDNNNQRAGSFSSGSLSTTATVQSSSSQVAAPEASLRLQVRRLQSSAGEKGASGGEKEPPTTSTRRSHFLYTLTSTISRSRSTDCASSSSAAPEPEVADTQATAATEAEFEYEISLIEARNVAQNRQVPGEIDGGGRAAIFRGRRDSLLGALVAAAGGAQMGGSQAASMSPGAKRRGSVEGIFARVFKQQTADGQWTPAAGTGGDSSALGDGGGGGSLGRHARLSPLSSCSSAGGQVERATGGGAGQPDCLQLPLLKMSPLEAGQELVNFERLSQGQGYKFLCRPSEFPVRLSLYQVCRRNGARLTLGHCILTPSDWLTSSERQRDDGRQPSQTTKLVQQPQLEATLERHSTGATFATIEESRDSATPTERSITPPPPPPGQSNEQSEEATTTTTTTLEAGAGQQPKVWSLEYRLHQTILEAIRAG